jgi:hypothetical protein
MRRALSFGVGALTADILALHVGLVHQWIHRDEVSFLEASFIPLVDLLFDPSSEWQAHTAVGDVDDKLNDDQQRLVLRVRVRAQTSSMHLPVWGT